MYKKFKIKYDMDRKNINVFVHDNLRAAQSSISDRLSGTTYFSATNLATPNNWLKIT